MAVGDEVRRAQQVRKRLDEGLVIYANRGAPARVTAGVSSVVTDAC